MKSNINWGRLKSITAFVITLSLCLLLNAISIINRVNVEKLTMEKLIMEKSIKANEVLSRLFFKTHTISTLLMRNNGNLEDFEQIAATIVDDPAILNILIAPDGIVTNVYPLRGNEEVLGLNFYTEGAGNKEAIMAMETGQLVFGGPFLSVQGEQVLVGRLPVYLTNDDDERYFWGLVSVTLRYPQALDNAGLNELELQGFAYEIWRTNPDDGQKQIITASNNNLTSDRYIEKYISIQNSDWYFRIMPYRAWYEYPDAWLLIFLGLCISVLVAFVVKNNNELGMLKEKYKNLSNTDPLTGIQNRRYFLESAAMQVERIIRTNSNAYLIIFDIDHFKNVNDVYGHASGDYILINVVKRVKDSLRPYDIFSRYGGEEFIILATDIDKANAHRLAERIRINIMKEPFIYDANSITVTASFGVARVQSAKDFEKSIDMADKALYAAKSDGRNMVMVHEEDGTFTNYVAL